MNLALLQLGREFPLIRLRIEGLLEGWHKLCAMPPLGFVVNPDRAAALRLVRSHMFALMSKLHAVLVLWMLIVLLHLLV